MKNWIHIVVFSMFLTLGGCQIFPSKEPLRSQVSAPDRFQALGDEWGAGEVPSPWLEEFDDPQLRSLTEAAFLHNPDLGIAWSRLEQARAEAKIAGADLWPSLAFSGNATRRRINTIGGGIQVGSTTVSSYDPVFSSSWEVDLWGRIRDGRKAAVREFEASTFELEGARLSLAAQVAKAWYALLETREQLTLSMERLKTFESNERLIETQYERGLTNALDYRLIRSQTRSARGLVEQQQATLDSQIRQLETVLGSYPGRELRVLGALPEITTPVATGLPSDLLERRPDIQAAQRRLEAAARRHQASVKLRYPQVNLSATGGTSSNQWDDLADSDFRVWSLVGGLTAPLFQGGRIEGSIAQAEAVLDQVGENVRKQILNAFREVETALAAERYLKTQRNHLESVVEETLAAESLAWDRYRRGLVDVVTVLETQRRAFDAQSNLLSIHGAQIQNRIDLYLALGGPLTEAGNELPDVASVPEKRGDS